MKQRVFLMLAMFIAGSITAIQAQIKKTSGAYTVSWISEVIRDKENGNDVENAIALSTKTGDSLTVYQWLASNREKPVRIVFWGEKKEKSNSIEFLSSAGGKLKVTFLPANKVSIDSDMYILNPGYYSFLRQKLLSEKSILDLAFFLKDGYGDYAVYLAPIVQKNWRNQKEKPRYKILEVQVKNKNEQTDDQFHRWKAIYKYKTNGELQSITGEFYKKKLISNTGKEVRYLVERILDRSDIKEMVVKNQHTLFDSVAVNWTQYSTSKEFYYTKFQNKLKVISVTKKPGSFEELAKLLKIKIK